MIGTLVLWTFAAIGVLAVVSSVGVFVMTYRLDDPDPDVAAIVEAHTQPSHVRVVPHRAVVGTFGHGAPDVVKCIHCGEPASHACDLDDFIAHNATTDRDAS